ncbi:MAG: preprotein translocase subunit YajC [Deltaproteobacteria bacterium]|nr:preprotein translocase subunit YajC [Deltaproteobacteria bacterium]
MINMLWAADVVPKFSPVVQQLLFFGLIFAIFYFLLIRPQQKRAKNHRELLDKLQRGDEVVTSSGLYGTVTGVTDSVVTVEISENVKVKIAKSHIAGKVVEGQQK